MTVFNKNQITINGQRQRVWHLKQNPDNLPIVMLHEGLGCLELWRDFPEQLARQTGRDVILFERFGHGRSGILPGDADHTYLFNEAREALPEMLNIMGIKKAVFFGHSDGGSIALLFAATYPERSAGIISLAAHVYGDPIGLAGIKGAIESFEHGGLKDKMTRFHGEGTSGVFWRWARTWTSNEARNWRITDQLPLIHCPVFALQGELDEYGEASQVEAIASGVSGPSEACIIPNCGHTPHLEVPDYILQKIDELIGLTSETG